MTESVSSDEEVFSEDDESTDDDDYDYNSFVSFYFYEKPPVRNRLQPLVPEDVTNDYCGAIQFIENFLERYEILFPIFFEGSLGEAIEEALITRVDDEPKLLIIYLHHVLSVCSNVFCSQVLCSEPVYAHLSRNFIVWGWDMTAESNRKSLLKIIEQQFGMKWRQYLQLIGEREDNFPLMLVFNPCCSVLTVSTSNIEVIRGKCSADEVMTKLVDSVDRFRRLNYLF